MSTSDSTLPSNTRAILMTSMDTSVDRIDVIARMLTARGYKVDGASMSSNNMDVNTLRELGGAVNGTSVDQSGNEIGVLYIMSHGKVPSMGEQLMNALGTPLPPFVLLTSQAPSPNDSQDLALQSDLNANPPRVVLEPKNDLFTRGASGKVVIAGTGDRYGVTTDFFRFYWRGKIFADDSLVFVNACGSAAADFQQVLAGCGAGLVLGWTGITAEEAEAATADFVFDRFLGTNNSDPAFFPEVLPQRPFDWTFVQGDLVNHNAPTGLLPGTGGGALGVSNFPSLNSTMTAFGGGPRFCLVPSITALGLESVAQKHLFVNGEFGSDPRAGGGTATVTMLSSPVANSGGQSLNIVDWSPQMITCDVPAQSGVFAGYVVVCANGVTSNCVPLTEWNGHVVTAAKGDGSLAQTMTWTYRLRMDAHHFRTNVTGPLSASSYSFTGEMPAGAMSAAAAAALAQATSAASASDTSATGADGVPGDAGAAFLFAMASADSQCSYHAEGSATYPAPALMTRALSGDGTVPVVQAALSGSAGGTAVSDCADIRIMMNWWLDSFPAETHDITMNLVSPGQTVPPRYTVQMTTTNDADASQPPSTGNLDVFEFFGDFTNPRLALLKDSASWDLPDPGKSTPGLGADWSVETVTGTVNLTGQTVCPPVQAMGEDYIQVLAST